MNRKILSIIMAVFLALSFSFTGCSKKSAGNKKPVVLCSTFPVYDWARNIIGDSDAIDLQLLNTKGTDMHSFNPSIQDMARISSADVVFYIGGESEKWLEEILPRSKNENQKAVSMMDLLGRLVLQEKNEGIFEGEEEENPGKDEHVWLSLGNASVCCFMMTSYIQALDSENYDKYFQNCKAYRYELEMAFEVIKSALREPPVLLFADRFPFRYFAEDFGLTCYAAFPGCSAETEASFSTVISLAKVMKENNLSKVYILEKSNPKIAEQIVSTSGCNAEIRVLDSMQGVSAEQISAGATYLGIMEKNLEALVGSDKM